MMTTSPEIDQQSFDSSKVLSWWKGLQPDPDTRRPGDAGALADLRRCRRVADVTFVPVFELLVRKMPDARIEDLAVVAGVIAHVRAHRADTRVAEQIARTTEGGQPTVSPLRFRRLLQVNGAQERLAAGVRLVRQLKGTVDVVDLAASLYWWDANDRTQRAWARSYYGTLPAEFLKKN